MPDVIKSIGTAGRDYADPVAWEADLDNGTVYNSGDVAIGQGYNDSVFNFALIINGGGTVGLIGVILSAAPGQGHTGIAGTGVRNVCGTTNTNVVQLNTNSAARPNIIEDWELTTIVTLGLGPILFLSSSVAGGIAHARRCIIHGQTNTGSAGVAAVTCGGGGRIARLTNSIVYDVENTNVGSTGVVAAIRQSGTNETTFDNVTIDNTRNASTTTGEACGFDLTDDNANARVRNTSVTRTTVAGGTGTALDFNSTPTSAVYNNNLSSDATASGTGSLINQSAADLFVSIVAGSEDYNLKAGANAIGAGANLTGNTPEIEKSINGQTRPPTGPWDIGASAYVGAAVPDAPTGLTATTNGNDIDLAWTDNATDELDYQVERSPTGGGAGFVEIEAALAADSTTYKDVNPGAGTWHYRVRCRNATGYSDYSNEDSATIAPPSVSVVLNWQHGAGQSDPVYAPEQYRIRRSVDGGAETQIDTVAGTLLTYTDVDPPGTERCYRVEPFTTGPGAGIPSNQDCVSEAPGFITPLGFSVGSTLGTTPIVLSLTGFSGDPLQENDLVVVSSGMGTLAAETGTHTVVGFTQEKQTAHVASSNRAVQTIAWKRMGATPDTSVTVNINNGEAANGNVAVARAYRNSHPTTPFVLPFPTTTVGDSRQPQSPPITTDIVNCYVVSSVVVNDEEPAITAPSGYSSPGNEHQSAGGIHAGLGTAHIEKAVAGLETPGAWSGWQAGAARAIVEDTYAVRPGTGGSPVQGLQFGWYSQGGKPEHALSESFLGGTIQFQHEKSVSEGSGFTQLLGLWAPGGTYRVRHDNASYRLSNILDLYPTNQGTGPEFAAVAAGTYDAQIQQLAQYMIDSGHADAVMRIYHEMDLPFLDYTFRDSVTVRDDGVAAYRRIVEQMRLVPGQQFEFQYAVNGPAGDPTPQTDASTGQAVIDHCYPGDAWNDSISCSIYDFDQNRVCQDGGTALTARFNYVNAFAVTHNLRHDLSESGVWEVSGGAFTGCGDDPAYLQLVYDLMNGLPAAGPGRRGYWLYFNGAGNNYARLELNGANFGAFPLSEAKIKELRALA